MNNPLIKPILTIIENHSEGIREYELLQQIEQSTTLFADLGSDPRLVLFRKHFLIMNALYQLQARLWQEDEVKLSISPLNIIIERKIEQKTEKKDEANIETTTSSQSTEVDDAAEAKLAAYYLDWNEYDRTQAEDVEALLKGFYDKLHNHDDTQRALKELGLSSNSSKTEIKRAYRQQVKEAHPDKGGDTKVFIKLRRAYEHLMSHTT